MAQNADETQGRCPHLGILADPESYFAFPAQENACHKLARPENINTTFQRQYCLGEYGACPLYQHEGPWTDALPKEAKPDTPRRSSIVGARPPLRDPIAQRNRRRNIAIIIGVTIAVGIGLFWAAFNILPGALGLEPTPTLFVTAERPPTETPTATATATPTATATGEPTATPTITPTFTPDDVVTIEVLQFESFLREGPDTGFESLTLVPAGTEVGVIARDLDGFWLLVELSDGTQGWVALTQFEGDPDVLAIPVATNIPPTLTPVPTEAGGGDPPPEPTTEG